MNAGRAGLIAALIACLPPEGLAQPIAASTLKAAFVVNFVKFTEWPTRKPELPILLCVFGDEILSNALITVVGSQRVDNRAIQVMRLLPDGPVHNCQVLFVAEREPRRFAAKLSEAGPFPVLTVSDTEDAAENGAIVEFFLENDRLRFAVNVDAMDRSRVKVSSRLLTLARIVRDKPMP